MVNGKAKPGNIKLPRARRGIWSVLISVSMEVPEPKEATSWIGVDRGQNIPAVAALPHRGRLFFFKVNRIKHVRRVFAERHKKLQSAGKHRAVKKLERRERRIVTHINHKLSKEIVGLAVRCGHGLRFEDLSGIRKAARQRKKTKADAGENRDYWPFYQLEAFSKYKAVSLLIPVENRPARYTSQTHFYCGRLGNRVQLDFYCSYCARYEHADGNAARNIGGWAGLFSIWEPSKGPSVIDGADDSPRNLVREADSSESV